MTGRTAGRTAAVRAVGVRTAAGLAAGVLVALGAAGCGGPGGAAAGPAAPSAPSSAPPSAAPAVLTVTSSAFTDNGPIPLRYSCDGKSQIPPLSWTGVPKGTGWLAVTVDDNSTYPVVHHWYVVDIPPGTSGITPGGPLPGRTVEGWLAPCPGGGATDDYVFTVYALPKDYRPTRLGESLVYDATGLAAHALAMGTVNGSVTGSV